MGDLIKEIFIENFRSVRRQRFTTDSHLTPILGLNSAGKSNILRALDLFFNDAVEGSPISFAHDLSSHIPGGTKKRICVGIHLNPEKTLGLKGNREFLKNNGLTEGIFLKKEWSLTRNGRSIQQLILFGDDFETVRTPERGEEDSVLALVRSIRYHYVSNHVRPADKVKEVLESATPRNNEDLEEFQQDLRQPSRRVNGVRKSNVCARIRVGRPRHRWVTNISRRTTGPCRPGV
ncbi:AAA family ATPase [Rhodococcus sp. D2-41]|nr:AAA family ATPase [Rhodococcus sp. D2-41]